MTSEARLARLERELRRAWRTQNLLLGLVVLLLVGFAWAAAPGLPRAPEEVRASKFVLVDGAGRERAVLSADENETVLSFQDAKGTRRIALAAHGSDAGLMLHDDRGAVRVGLMMTSTPALLLHDGEGVLRVDLSVPDGLPRLGLRDEDGTLRLQLGGSRSKKDDGAEVGYPESTLLLFDSKGELRRVLP